MIANAQRDRHSPKASRTVLGALTMIAVKAFGPQSERPDGVGFRLPGDIDVFEVGRNYTRQRRLSSQTSGATVLGAADGSLGSSCSWPNGSWLRRSRS